MGLAESTPHAGPAALSAKTSRKPRLAASPDLQIVQLTVDLAERFRDRGLAALEADAIRAPPGPPVELQGPHGGLMARAVGGVGGDAAPDATAAAATNASGLGLAPVASERDAGGRTVPLPVARQWLPADPAREDLQAVVHPAARQARGFLELD